MAKKRRINAAKDSAGDDCDDDNDNEDDDEINTREFEENREKETQELSLTLIETIGLKHPIMYDKHNICQLSTQKKLSKFTVKTLKEICISLELDISDITKKQKKPYLDLLDNLVCSCSCRENR